MMADGGRDNLVEDNVVAAGGQTGDPCSPTTVR